MTALRLATTPTYLTDRELRVLTLIADGRELAEIATEMSYALRTVKNIAHDAKMKLGAHTLAHAVAIALQQGVLVPRDKIGLVTQQYITHLEQERDHYRTKLDRVRKALQ